MTRFTGRVLRYLDSIWRFVGGIQGLTDMTLEGSVQPVVDLSRLAELGSGLGASEGYFMREHTSVHPGGGGVIRDVDDPWNFVDTFEPNRERANVYILGVWAQHNNANVDTTGVSLTYPLVGDASLFPRQLLIGFWDGEIPVDIVAAGPRMMVNLGAAVSGQGNAGLFARLPLWVPSGSALNFMSSASGSGTSVVTVLMWAGAKGATPPGLR